MDAEATGIPARRPSSLRLRPSTLLFQHGSTFQPMAAVDPSLIFIQVKDSTDGVKDPVAMVTWGWDRTVWCGDALCTTTEGAGGRSATTRCVYAELISFDNFYHLHKWVTWGHIYKAALQSFFPPLHYTVNIWRGVSFVSLGKTRQRDGRAGSALPGANCVGLRQLM